MPQNIERLNGQGVCQIECGAQFSLALTKSGVVWTWYVLSLPPCTRAMRCAPCPAPTPEACWPLCPISIYLNSGSLTVVKEEIPTITELFANHNRGRFSPACLSW